MKQTVLIYAAVAGIFLWLSAGILPAGAKETRILFLGDSITAGLGVEKEAAFPAVVGRMLKQQRIDNVTVINAGISGSTTASGPSRLKWHLKTNPQVLVLALGANDGLRGLPLDSMAENLDDTIALALENNLCVILAGMEIPPNYGPEYTGQFRQTFQDLASKYQIALIPFLLDNVGGVEDMNQADGVHPNPAGHRQIAATVLPYIKECL
ncbi:MAG: arylesterase [Desulfotignum sp.]